MSDETTIKNILTYDEALALQRAVAEKGEDYVYPSTEGLRECVYFEQNGAPSCIVGGPLPEADRAGEARSPPAGVDLR